MFHVGFAICALFKLIADNLFLSRGSKRIKRPLKWNRTQPVQTVPILLASLKVTLALTNYPFIFIYLLITNRLKYVNDALTTIPDIFSLSEILHLKCSPQWMTVGKSDICSEMYLEMLAWYADSVWVVNYRGNSLRSSR